MTYTWRTGPNSIRVRNSNENVTEMIDTVFHHNGLSVIQILILKYDWVLIITRSDILQGQALFRGVKQLKRCLGMLNNFVKFSFQRDKRQRDRKK